MRKGKLTSDEVLAAEKAKDDRVQSRKQGFKKMEERDAGIAILREYYHGGRVRMRWDIDNNPNHANHFMLEIPGGRDERTVAIVLDAEEFRKSLRWV